MHLRILQGMPALSASMRTNVDDPLSSFRAGLVIHVVGGRCQAFWGGNERAAAAKGPVADDGQRAFIGSAVFHSVLSLRCRPEGTDSGARALFGGWEVRIWSCLEISGLVQLALGRLLR